MNKDRWLIFLSILCGMLLVIVRRFFGFKLFSIQWIILATVWFFATYGVLDLFDEINE